MTDDERTALEEGVVLFDAGKFWHAHEAWERPWLKAQGDVRQFLQGLIQLAAAFHHVQRGTDRGAMRLFDAALAKLAPYPEGVFGLDRAAVVKCAKTQREKIANGVHIDRNQLPKFR
jgi:predicted metal-dependent hydrolase